MEAEADIRLLLECMKCQGDNPAALKQALVTMATICTNQATSQEYLRKCGGLQFIFKLSISARDQQVKQATLYTLGCAIDKNIYSQKELCSQSVFCQLYEILVSGHSSVKLIQTAVFLLICLVANNNLGQVLVNKSKCLHNMLDLFRSSLKCPGGSQSSWLEELDGSANIELWSSITSALCVCVNNPQNEENQRLCTQVFPQAFRYLQDYHQIAVVRPAVSFIGLAVANNVHNQDRVLKCGGLEVLVSILYRTTNQIHLTGCEDGVEGRLSVCSAIISAIDAVITDNAVNAQRCGELGVVGMLLRLLQCSVLGPTERLQVTVMLGHCIDASEANQSELVGQGGMAVLLQQLTDQEEEELSKATKYVLQSCIHADKNSRKDVHLKDLNSMMQLTNDFAPLLSPPHDLRNDEIQKKLEKLEKALARQGMAFDAASLSSEDTVPSLRMVTKPKQWDPCGAGLPGRTQQKKRSAKLQRLQPDGCVLRIRSETDGVQNEDDGKSDLESEAEKLKAELEKEQALRKKLEAEAVEARKALEEKKQQEAAVANKAAALTAEFEKQQQDEGLDDDAAVQKKQREEQSKREHERLLLLKREKQREMTELENQLAGLETPRDEQIQRSRSETQTVDSSRGKMTTDRSRPSANSSSVGTAREVNSKATSTATVGVQTPTRTDGFSGNGNRAEELQKETETRRQRDMRESPKDSPMKRIPVVKSPRHQAQKTGHKRIDRDGFLVPNSPALKTKIRTLPSTDDSVWKHSTFNRFTPVKNTTHSLVAPPSPTPSIESILDQELLKTAAGGGKTRGLLSVRHSTKRLNRRSIPQLPRLTSPSPRKFDDESARKAWSVVPRKDKRSSFHMRKDDRDASFEGKITVPEVGSLSPGSAVSTLSVTTSTASKTVGNMLCPGCQAPGHTDRPLLNSRTYNIALETNSHTCPAHRAMRDQERQYIAERRRRSPGFKRNRLLRDLKGRRRDDKPGKQRAKGTTDVYSFDSGTGSSTDECYVSPAEEALSSDTSHNPILPRYTLRTPRRPRVPYTRDEVHSLVTGVQKYGRSWGQILRSFKFHPNRTGIDLKEKYQRLMRSDQEEALSTTERKPRRSFSMVEERRLKRGVRNLGYNWRGILATYKFAKGRSASELRDKWKTMNSRRNRRDRNKTLT